MTCYTPDPEDKSSDTLSPTADTQSEPASSKFPFSYSLPDQASRQAGLKSGMSSDQFTGMRLDFLANGEQNKINTSQSFNSFTFTSTTPTPTPTPRSHSQSLSQPRPKHPSDLMLGSGYESLAQYEETINNNVNKMEKGIAPYVSNEPRRNQFP